MTELLKARDAAERIGVSINTIRRWAASGKLPSYRICERGDFRFDPDKIDEYLRRKKR